MAKQDQPERDYAVGGWVNQMEHDDGAAYTSGRRRTSGLGNDHDAAGGMDSLITFHTPGAVAIAGAPGLCSSCGAPINPLTVGCRC